MKRFAGCPQHQFNIKIRHIGKYSVTLFYISEAYPVLVILTNAISFKPDDEF